MSPRRLSLTPIAITISLFASGAQCVDQDLLEDPPTSTQPVRLTEIASGLFGDAAGVTQFFPTDLAPFPDGSGRLAVSTLGGVVRLIRPDGTLDPTPYLVATNPSSDIDPGHYGMTSIAFHPDFAVPGAPGEGKFYLIETEDRNAGTPDFDGSIDPVSFGGPHHDVLYEYTATDTSADLFSGSKREVLRVEQPGWDHNVTDLTFGVGPARGYLHLTSGDGSNGNEGTPPIRDNPQFLGNVFGKILRIDPLGGDSANGQYGIPPGNPFVGVVGALPEIYSYGHRSPYRLTVDRATGALWLGEVGQRQIEEVNIVTAGANYGWPLKEGSFLFNELDHDDNQPDPDLDMNGTGDFADANNLIDPVFELDHQSSRSVTGGYVYRGAQIPALGGRYVFGDAVSNALYIADPSGGPVSGQTGGVERLAIDPSGDPMPFGTISIGEDAEGELYILGLDGRIVRIDRLPCDADLNDDAVASFPDVGLFLAAFAAADPAADFTGDGSVGFPDVGAYLAAFAAGCP